MLWLKLMAAVATGCSEPLRCNLCDALTLRTAASPRAQRFCVIRTCGHNADALVMIRSPSEAHRRRQRVDKGTAFHPLISYTFEGLRALATSLRHSRSSRLVAASLCSCRPATRRHTRRWTASTRVLRLAIVDATWPLHVRTQFTH